MKLHLRIQDSGNKTFPCWWLLSFTVKHCLIYKFLYSPQVQILSNDEAILPLLRIFILFTMSLLCVYDFLFFYSPIVWGFFWLEAAVCNSWLLLVLQGKCLSPNEHTQMLSCCFTIQYVYPSLTWRLSFNGKKVVTVHRTWAFKHSHDEPHWIIIHVTISFILLRYFIILFIIIVLCIVNTLCAVLSLNISTLPHIHPTVLPDC